MRTISTTVFFAIAAVAADRPEVPAPAVAVGSVAPVLRSQEPGDNRFVALPGPPPPPPLPQAQLPAAPAAAMAILPTAPKLTALPEEPRPILRRAPKPFLPPDFERDSAAYCQQRIGEWSEPDVYNLFGKALRHRPASGDGKEGAGLVFAFSDPSGKYRELELDFASDTGLLRSVFAYPWQMTWSEAKRQWGTEVTAAQANKGRKFYSYLNRRLDVLVDPDGKIVSLGLY